MRNHFSVVPPAGAPPVVNGFDLNAAEAAIQLAESDPSTESEITVISAGHGFALDVMKKPLAMGAHRLVLIDDPLLSDIPAAGTVRVLTAAIRKTGPYDLILCGRQASDWDQGHVPMGIAEALGDALHYRGAGMAKAGDGMLRVDRALEDGYQVGRDHAAGGCDCDQRVRRAALSHPSGNHGGDQDPADHLIAGRHRHRTVRPGVLPPNDAPV